MPTAHDFTAFTLAQTGAPAPAQPTAQAPTSDQIVSGTANTPAAPGSTAAPSSTPAQNPGGGLGPLVWLPVLLIFMWLMMALPGRKEKKRREQMMAALGKGDKVITIGGQLGTVDQVRDNEVVLRIDENSNTKARFTKAAIQQVVESAGGAPVSSPAVEVKARNDNRAIAAK